MVAALVILSLVVAQADDYPDDSDLELEQRPHVVLSAWGGKAFADGGSGHGSPLFGGEAAWAFDSLDVGIAGYGYQGLPDAARDWSPVVLVRLTQRFETRKGLDATFTFGAGAGRTDRWDPWFQVALGVRGNAGPFFIAGELAFEQLDQLRLAAGVGVRF